jgi:hypothetical protein
VKELEESQIACCQRNALRYKQACANPAFVLEAIYARRHLLQNTQLTILLVHFSTEDP